jgi:hypothetical protein
MLSAHPLRLLLHSLQFEVHFLSLFLLHSLLVAQLFSLIFLPLVLMNFVLEVELACDWKPRSEKPA